MARITSAIGTALELGGIAAVVVGFWLIAPALGLIVGGLLAVGVGFLVG